MSAFTEKKLWILKQNSFLGEKMKIDAKTNFFEKNSILDEIWKSAKKCQKIDIFFKKKLNFIFIEFHFYKS